DLALLPEIGRAEGQQRGEPEGNRGPQDPGPELAPARVGAVRQQAHQGIEAGADDAADEDDGSRGARADLVHVRVEEGDEGQEGLEDQVGGEVAQAVAELLDYSQACRGRFWMAHVSRISL